MKFSLVSRALKTLAVLWVLWMVLLPCLWDIAVHIVPFAFAGFQFSSHHGLAIAHSVSKGALWLIPASFLLMLYWWIRTNKAGILQG